jgi:ABC-type polar amino acid transport system ATPase subunit
MIRAEGLRRRLGGHVVLDGASLEVERGEVAVVVGASGSGKSTLLRCLNGLEAFDEGELRVGELHVPRGVHPVRDAALLRALRRRLGLVFQGYHLFPHLSVIDNLVLAPVDVLGEPADSARARARTLLERVGLAGKEDRLPKDLSGGQQQRVAIARALAMRPEALLFDEPTSALDPRAASDVLALISELAREGQTMVVVTHAIRLARRVATKVHVMEAGRVVEHGRPDEVLGSPRHEATRWLVEHEADA